MPGHWQISWQAGSSHSKSGEEARGNGHRPGQEGDKVAPVQVQSP